MSSIRTVTNSVGLYQGISGNGSQAQRARNPSGDIFRQHVDTVQHTHRGGVSHPFWYVCAKFCGFSDIPHEIGGRSNTKFRVPGFPDQYNLHADSGTGREDKEVAHRDSCHRNFKPTISEESLPCDWQDGLTDTGNSTSPTFLQGILPRPGNQDYKIPCTLSRVSMDELDWWIVHLQGWNGKWMLTIESDASLMGWETHQNPYAQGDHGIIQREIGISIAWSFRWLTWLFKPLQTTNRI